jgi:hypothetical protein
MKKIRTNTPEHSSRTLLSLLAWLLLAARALALDPVLPNPTLTPGEMLPQFSQDDICALGFAKAHRPSRTESTALKKLVFERYGIAWSRHAEFELDHDIPLCLGGSNALANLWPEPFSGSWNAYLKDDLEIWLYDQVCAGTMSLRDAQEQISTNWIECYKRAFGDPYSESESVSQK